MTLFVEPLPSVVLFQECSMLIRACLVLEFGMDPNCLLSILANTAGFRCRSTTKSSAINFDRIGVKDIGRKWLLISLKIAKQLLTFKV